MLPFDRGKDFDACASRHRLQVEFRGPLKDVTLVSVMLDSWMVRHALSSCRHSKKGTAYVHLDPNKRQIVKSSPLNLSNRIVRPLVTPLEFRAEEPLLSPPILPLGPPRDFRHERWNKAQARTKVKIH